jgi:hypothetical protein
MKIFFESSHPLSSLPVAVVVAVCSADALELAPIAQQTSEGRASRGYSSSPSVSLERCSPLDLEDDGSLILLVL